MHVIRHYNFASLVEQLAIWNELANGVPFRRWEWMEAWWRHYGAQSDGGLKGNRELFVLTITDDDGNLVGIAPWYRLRTRSGAWVIRFLGDGEVCSDYLSLLCRTGQEIALTETIASWLTETSDGEKSSAQGHHHYRVPAESQNGAADCRWDRLEFTGVEADDSLVNLLLAKLETAGNRLHFSSALNAWRIALPASWEEFLMVLSKPHRNRLRRADKNYFQTGRVTVHYLRAADHIDKFFDILVRLHQGRWQRRGMPGCFASPAFFRFHREVAERLLISGEVTLSWLELDGSPLTAEYRLHGDTIMYAYQCGIDPDRLKVQPGELANMAAIRHAIEHGQTAFDFLRGDEPYKAHWRARPRAMLSVRVVPRRTSAQLRHTVWVAGQQVKHWVKSGIQLTRLRSGSKATAATKSADGNS